MRLSFQAHHTAGQISSAIFIRHQAIAIASSCPVCHMSSSRADGVAFAGLETRERREQAEALSTSIREYVDQVRLISVDGVHSARSAID